MQRRTALLGAALAAFTSLLTLGAGAAHAQAYPERSIKLVVPYAPGGSADIAARLISDAWGKALGGSMFIENKAGAGGNLGVDAVAKAPADGYTIGLQTVSLAINPALTPKMPYDTLKDLAPIGMVASSQHVLVVNNNLPARSLKELLAMLRSSPGKYTYGSAGSGSTFHMSAELFKAVAGVSVVHIPYRGGGPALTDTIAGQAVDQRLRGEHVLDLAGADPEREGAERAVRGGVAVAAHDRQPGLGQAELGTDDVHDAPPRVAHPVQLDTELGAVPGEHLHLLGGDGVLDRAVTTGGRVVVVDRRHGEVWAADGPAVEAQPVERLGRGDFVHEV